MSSLRSSEMEDQITIWHFLGVMEQAMSILAVEEGGSSLAPWPKRRQRYVNRDHEAAYLKLRLGYFDDDCVYPRHTSTGGTICGELFS
jgi:hypothetical protein